MILRKPLYGDINAAEAVRHALGAASGDWKVSLILVDGGVLVAKKGHDDAGTGFTNLETTLNDCIDMGVNVYADPDTVIIATNPNSNLRITLRSPLHLHSLHNMLKRINFRLRLLIYHLLKTNNRPFSGRFHHWLPATQMTRYKWRFNAPRSTIFSNN